MLFFFMAYDFRKILWFFFKKKKRNKGIKTCRQTIGRIDDFLTIQWKEINKPTCDMLATIFNIIQIKYHEASIVWI